MPVATFTDTYITTTPWDRKTDLYTGFKTALTNAGFTTDIDEYDRRENLLYEWYVGSYSQLEANGSNSIIGIVKEVVLDGTKAKGTIQLDFCITKCTSNSITQHSAANISGTDFNNYSSVPGVYAMWGGWDSTNMRRILYTTTDTATGSWWGGKPTYTANMHNYDGEMLSGLNGNIDTGIDSQWNSSNNSRRNRYPSGYIASIGYNNTGLNTHDYGSELLIRAPHPDYPLLFKSINHPEIKGVFMIQQNRAPAFFGYVRPANKPSWWDEDSFPYVFIPNTTLFTLYQGFSGSYFPVPSTPWYAYHELVSPDLNLINPVTNKYEVIAAPLIKYATNRCFLGKYSEDFILVPPQIKFLDKVIITAGVEEYTCISANKPNSSSLSGLAVRTT